MKDLVRNPLGIVALFISLIYGIAGLLLGATVSSLDHDERYPIIMFVVLFPIVVLGVFYRLVSRHHGKLYAPGDYKDDKSFLRTLSPAERQEKLENEFAEAELPVNFQARSASGLNVKTAPTVSKPEAEYAERFLPLYEEWRRAEAAGINYLSREFGRPETRDVGFGDTGVSFDAMFRSGSNFVFAEVKLLSSMRRSVNLLDRVLYNAVIADRYLPGSSKFVILVVHRMSDESLEAAKAKLRQQVDRSPVNIELRYVHWDELPELHEPAK